jgi:predicted MPP superfamily phosphohydrolase
LIAFLCAAVLSSPAQLVVAQISDAHIGVSQAPDAAAKLALVVKAVNARHPDLVIMSGDIGENPDAWRQAKSILGGLKAPIRYVPGNHDVHSNDVGRYRSAFGDDYYTFSMKGVTFVAIDSQLLGDFDNFQAKSAPALPTSTQRESDKMLNWMEKQAASIGKQKIVIGVQHIPDYRNGDFPPDPKPYWVVNEPYRSREMALLKRMGIHHMLVGHWHRGMIFDAGGLTWHVAPATSWLPWGGELGFALHTIGKDGSVKTEFLDLKGNGMGSHAATASPPVSGAGCAAPAGRGVAICSPADGAVVASPVHVSAAVAGKGRVTVIQVYVDGRKGFELPGATMETDIPLKAGTHRLTVQGLDQGGFFKRQVNITVR